MDLSADLDHFVKWLSRYGLPGFKEFCEDTYNDEDYRTYSEELEYLGSEMRKSVARGDQGHYEVCKEAYSNLYNRINTFLAKREYESFVSKLLNEGYEELDAQTQALEYLWQNPKMQYWLPAKARMTNKTSGEQVFIVANERHIPQESLFVLTSELESLKKSGRDPWEFVRNRKAS